MCNFVAVDICVSHKLHASFQFSQELFQILAIRLHDIKEEGKPKKPLSEKRYTNRHRQNYICSHARTGHIRKRIPQVVIRTLIRTLSHQAYKRYGIVQDKLSLASPLNRMF